MHRLVCSDTPELHRLERPHTHGRKSKLAELATPTRPHPTCSEVGSSRCQISIRCDAMRCDAMRRDCGRAKQSLGFTLRRDRRFLRIVPPISSLFSRFFWLLGFGGIGRVDLAAAAQWCHQALGRDQPNRSSVPGCCCRRTSFSYLREAARPSMPNPPHDLVRRRLPLQLRSCNTHRRQRCRASIGSLRRSSRRFHPKIEQPHHPTAARSPAVLPSSMPWLVWAHRHCNSAAPIGLRIGQHK